MDYHYNSTSATCSQEQPLLQPAYQQHETSTLPQVQDPFMVPVVADATAPLPSFCFPAIPQEDIICASAPSKSNNSSPSFSFAFVGEPATFTPNGVPLNEGTSCETPSEACLDNLKKRKLEALGTNYQGSDVSMSIPFPNPLKAPKLFQSVAGISNFISQLTKSEPNENEKTWGQNQLELQQKFHQQIEYYSNKEKQAKAELQASYRGKCANQNANQEYFSKYRDTLQSFMTSRTGNSAFQSARSSENRDQHNYFSLWKVAITTTPSLTLSQIEKMNFASRFHLVQQPYDVQRKSYLHENRCIKPSPLMICIKDPSTAHLITAATVTVKLTTEDGAELMLPANCPAALSTLHGDPLTVRLDQNKRAKFTLKLAHTSGGRLMRLVFILKLNVYVGNELREVTEKVYSAPFLIYSNKGIKGCA